MPDVVFLRSKRQPSESRTEGAARASDESNGRNESTDHFMIEPENRGNRRPNHREQQVL